MTSGPSRHCRNIFVTGRPGVGKTTLIERVLEKLDVAVGGFVTSEIREKDVRVGFAIADLSGERGILARVGLRSEYRVGRYGVNREDLERIGIPAIRNAVERSELVVMDEIGRMELCSPEFRAEVERALDSPTPVLGTIQDRSDSFLDGVRVRTDVEVVLVTGENRDRMVGNVLGRVRELLGADGWRPA